MFSRRLNEAPVRLAFHAAAVVSALLCIGLVALWIASERNDVHILAQRWATGPSGHFIYRTRTISVRRGVIEYSDRNRFNVTAGFSFDFPLVAAVTVAAVLPITWVYWRRTRRR